MPCYCYVYNDENGQAYYVGKGQGRRRYQRHNVEIPPEEQVQIFEFEEDWQAWECEIELIAFWGRKCDGGTLLNVSTGGAGGTSGVPSPWKGKTQPEELKREQSLRMKGRYTGDKNPMWGKTHTPEARVRISKGGASRCGEDNGMHGRKHSEETRRKMSETKRLNREKRALDLKK